MFWCLATELAARGHQVRAITSDAIDASRRAAVLEENLADRIAVKRYRNRFNSLSARLGPIFFRPRGMRAAIEESMKWADVVHVGESRGPHNVWVSAARANTDTPVVWSPYGGLPVAPGIRGAYRAMYDFAYSRSIISRVDRFVAETAHESEVLIGLGAPNQRIRIIPLCVEWTDFAVLPAAGVLRRSLGIRDEDHLIVSVARLSPVKGLEIVVEAFARLQRTPYGPYLAMVGWDHGSGPLLRRLASQLGVADRVLFPGALLGDDRLHAYVDADVFALAPRVFEETSLAALEAAGCGTPTVVTRECEIPKLAESGGGYVVERTPAAIAATIESLLDCADLRREVGQTARQVVQDSLTTTRVAEMHEAVFAEVVST
jgi:glycosyltransferase involved in cell wall biosynthesis